MNIKQVLSLEHVGCYTDRYLIEMIDGDEHRGTAYLLSLFGTPARVQAIKAAFLSGNRVYLQDCRADGQPARWSVCKTFSETKAVTRRLAPDVAHCLISAPKYLDPECEYCHKIVFGNSQEQIFRKFFYAVQKHYATPLLPEWTEWLWREMAPEPLEILGFGRAFLVRFFSEIFLEKRLLEEDAPVNWAVN